MFLGDSGYPFSKELYHFRTDVKMKSIKTTACKNKDDDDDRYNFIFVY